MDLSFYFYNMYKPSLLFSAADVQTSTPLVWGYCQNRQVQRLLSDLLVKVLACRILSANISLLKSSKRKQSELVLAHYPSCRLLLQGYRFPADPIALPSSLLTYGAELSNFKDPWSLVRKVASKKYSSNEEGLFVFILLLVSNEIK